MILPISWDSNNSELTFSATAMNVSQEQHPQLSIQISGDFENVQTSIDTLQDQTDSLTAVILQNQGALHLLMVQYGEKGPILAFS